MSELEPPIQEQPVITSVQPPGKTSFSGKQVVGIVFGMLILLAIGVALGGLVGYRLGLTEGAQQALADRLAAQPPVFNQQLPQDRQLPRGFAVPFQELPAINPGGPYLGVTFQMITPEIAAQEGITGTTGALVREVVAAGPAAKAGLKPGDIVIAVNGQPVDANTDLRERVAAFKVNDEITLTVVTGTATGPIDQRDVKVKLGERPAEQSFNFEMPFEFDQHGLPQLPETLPTTHGAYLGIEYELLTPEVAARENLTGTTGALIKSVVADSPAAKAGLKAGDVISAVDGKTVDEQTNLRDMVLNHTAGDEITVTIITGTANGPTDQRDVKIILAERPIQPFQMPPDFQPRMPRPDSREG